MESLAMLYEVKITINNLASYKTFIVNKAFYCKQSLTNTKINKGMGQGNEQTILCEYKHYDSKDIRKSEKELVE